MLEKFKSGLARTRTGLFGRIGTLFGRKIDEELLEKLEESMILADMGPKSAAEIIELLRKSKTEDPGGLLEQEIIKRVDIRIDNHRSQAKPFVIMFVGVNGAGKTTSIGKLAARYISRGKSVMLAAADTFRAAAVEQLELWGEKTGAMVIKGQQGTDPAAVVFDTVKSAQARKVDYVLIDTAGRLQTRMNLMEELKKIKRVTEKALPGAPHECWLVLDASIGQNSFSQVELFHRALGLTGFVLAKLDGTAKGGAIIAIADRFKIPVKYIGLGESIDDLEEFDAKQFARALVEL
jgi:fused signal recognition particle receptor